jgi:hypothetical protein
MFLIYPQKKKSKILKLGLLGGHAIGPLMAINSFGNFAFKATLTWLQKWGGGNTSPLVGGTQCCHVYCYIIIIYFNAGFSV